jgi:hypothetical protein
MEKAQNLMHYRMNKLKEIADEFLSKANVIDDEFIFFSNMADFLIRKKKEWDEINKKKLNDIQNK